jgi:hypothetical protein
MAVLCAFFGVNTNPEQICDVFDRFQHARRQQIESEKLEASPTSTATDTLKDTSQWSPASSSSSESCIFKNACSLSSMSFGSCFSHEEEDILNCDVTTVIAEGVKELKEKFDVSRLAIGQLTVKNTFFELLEDNDATTTENNKLALLPEAMEIVLKHFTVEELTESRRRYQQQGVW